MLHFLSTLLSPAGRTGEALDEALIAAAIARAVDATDPRLRLLGNYRKRLGPAVQSTVSHVLALVDALPEPVETSRHTSATGPRLRAFDAIARKALERLIERRGRSSELRRQHHLLKRKLAAMKAGDRGLDAMFSHEETAPSDLKALEAEVDAPERELFRSGADDGGWSVISTTSWRSSPGRSSGSRAASSTCVSTR